MESFKHKNYDVFPTGQQLLNDDGSLGKWMALASVVLWHAEEVLSMAISWYPPAYDTKEEAAAHALLNAKKAIDEERLNF